MNLNFLKRWTQKTGLVFDSNEIQAVYRRGIGPFLLVTFAPYRFQADGKDFWAKTFVEKTGISALGFVCKQDTWYPVKAMKEAIAAVDGILRRHDSVLTYGGSMGAYAALKYGALLGADHCVAFAPQLSIDPADGSIPMYSKYFQPSLHENMAIAAGDVGKTAHLFFDPAIAYDLFSARAIQRIAPQTRLIPLPNTGHQCVQIFAGTAKATALLEGCIADDMRKLRAMGRRERIDHSSRLSGLATRMIKRSPETALKLIASRRQDIWTKHRAEFYSALALEYMSRKEWRPAEEALVGALEVYPKNPTYLRRMGAIHLFDNRNETAVGWYEKAAEALPDDASIHFNLARAYSRLKQWNEAQDAIKRALAIKPEEQDYLRVAANIETANRRAVA